MPTYDDLAADMAGAAEPQKPAGAATLYTAADVNPDAEAGLLKLSKRTGIPAEALRLDTARKDAERQSKANQYDTLLKSSPATAKWLDDLGNARLAHDDTESLSMLETGLGKLKNAGRAVLGGVSGFNEGFYGLAQIPAEAAQAAAQPLVGSLLPENPFTRMTEAIKARRQYEGATTKSLLNNPNAGPTERGIYSGIQSLTQNLMTLPLAVVSGNPELTLYPMAGQIGGQAYGQARDKGVSIPGSLSFGTSQAVIEYATEKIPVGRFLDDLAKNTGFTKMIAGQLASEIPGEQVATLLQDLNEWAVLNPEKPFKDYLAERPGAAYETLVATIVGTGGNVAIGKAGHAVANRMGAAAKAQEDGKTISDLVAEAGKNKVRARSPETFSQFVQQTAEQTGNAPTEVYIDAKQFQAALNQEGVDQGAIIAAMPSVAQQFDEAVSTGGDLVVPIGELLTATPGTPLEQSLIPHVRTSADAMSMAEAQDAQTNQADYFAQEADRILKEQADSTALQDKSQAVYDNVLEQLNAAGRFTPDVNKAYADLTRNFFVTLSGRTGQDINALYKQYGPTIAAQLPEMSGDALNATQKPLDQTMYRGVGEGSAQASAITWMSPDKTLADNYAAFRGGETQQLEHMPDKVFDAGRDANEMTAKQFAARALTQAAKLGTADKEAALAARDEFLKGASNTPDKITALWSSEDNAAKTSQFLKALGFDTIQLDENGVQTFGALGQPQAAQQLEQGAGTFDFSVPSDGNSLRDIKIGGTTVSLNVVGRHFNPEGIVDIASIRTPATKRGKGGARVAMQALIEQADSQGVTLRLDASPLDNKTQLNKLVAFYRSFGFEPTGRSNNALGHPEMLRQPQAAQQLEQNTGAPRDALNATQKPLEQGAAETQRAQARVLRKRADRSSDATKAETLRAQADALDAQAAEAETYAAGQPEAVGGQPQAPAMHKAPGPHNGVSIDQYQGTLEGDNLPSDAESIAALKAASGNPDAQITVYRAVPQGEDIRAGDWVSPSREYADMHGEATMGAGGFDIVEKQVPASELYTDGNSVNELGYRPAAQQLNQSAYTADTIEVDGVMDSGKKAAYANEFVAFSPEQIKSAVGNQGTFDPASPNILEQNTGAPRGAFNPDALTITLLKAADLTTFLHESAHYFLTVYEQIATQPNAPEGVAQDVDTLLQWMGVEPTPEQTRAEVWAGMSLDQKRKGHEQFAESFEQWLFGGKAPSMEMQSLFERFRTWMMRTYKSLQQFVATHKNAKLNPEIEQVFSRMLASEEQTKAAEQFRNMYPLFDSAEAAGMTPEQFAAYQAEGRDASAESAKDMTRRGLRDMQWLGNAKAKALKALQKEADALRDEVRKEVSDEVNAEPVYRVWQFLTGKKSEDNTTGKLLRADMVERYGADSEIVKTLEARKMLTNSGTQSDVLAETFGYSSGDEMVQALAAAEPPKAAIDAITDQRMLERHGEMATPDALERAAEAAIHNDARAKFLATEYAAVNKQLGSVRLIAKAAKEYAANIVARTRIMDIRPARYAAAEARAARMAAEAMRKGERDKVVTEKRNQLLNNATAKAMHEARDEAKSIAEYLKKFDKEGTRKNLDTEYLDQIDTLLERYDLRTGTSAKDIARRESLRTWVVRQLKNGDIPDIAETLLSPQERAKYKAEVESRDADGDLVYADDEERIKLLADAIDRSETRSYKELTMDELRGLYDTVRQIEHLGRMKHTLLTAVDQATYEAARDDIASTITGNANQSGKNTRTPNDWLGQKLAGLKQFGASHIKIATWARIMDGGKENGAVWRYLIRPANERASRETTMRAEATKALDEILRPLLAKVPMADKVGKGKFFPSIGESLNWQERFAVALNTGNEGNLQRLLDGRGWTMQQIMPVLNSLSAEEWHAVQKVWDHSESYRPQIAAKERRVTGKEPNWVEPREISVKTADGKEVTLRGGYYPVVYDPRVNLKAQQHTAAEEAKGLMKAAYSAATTRRSFTKERAEEVKGRPLLLNMQGLYSGVNDVIHDLTWHEWVIDMNKLLRSKTIDQAIREHYGPEVKREFEKWRDDVVAGTRRLDHGIEKAAAWARQGVSASGLTFNLMLAAMQPLGLTQSIVRVGAKWVGKGIARYVAHPIETTKEANEKSEWMRNRSRTRFRELNELRNQVQGQTVAREMLSAYGYFFMMRMQQAVDVPTWWGAYEKAIAQGEKEDTAVALADQAVKDAQGGGEEVDQAGIERGGPLIKLFTVFYSFMNTAANLGYGQARTESSKAKLAADMLLLYTVPAILGYALRNALTPGDSGDDDEELVKKLISEQLSYLMGLVAFGREFAQVGKVIMGEGMGQGYSGPAGLRVIPDSVALAKQAKQGEFDDAFRKSFINLAGDLFGLPAAQANRTITGAQALAEGKTANPAAIAFGYQEKK